MFEVETSHINLGRPWNSGILSTCKAGLDFRKKVLELNPEVLIGNCDLPEMLLAFFCPGKKIVCVEHVNRPWVKRRALGLLTRFILRLRGAHWVTVSGHLQPWAIKDQSFTTIRNPIILDRFKPQAVTTEIGNEIRRLVFVGRLNKEQKRPSWVLEIAGALDFSALIIGDGPELTYLKRMANEKQIDTEFVGQVQDPWKSFKRGDLLVVPSAWEGDGLVPIEAILMGIPLIVTEIPEFKYFDLPNRNYAHSIPEFVDKIRSHKNQLEYFQVQKEIVKRIESERSIGAISQQWIHLLDCLSRETK